jgi:hypothetical protein
MSEPVVHYFVRNTRRTKRVDYIGPVRKPMTLVICGRLLHGTNARGATKDKDEVNCKKCLARRFK